MSLFRCLFIAAAVSLTGCAATVVKSGPESTAAIHVPPVAASRLTLSVSGSDAAVKSSDWADFRGALRGAVAAEAAAANLPFSMQDEASPASGQDGTLLAVYVNDYHYVSTGARIGLGILTGNAFVDGKARFVDAKTGKSYGEQQFNTSSSAWQGVFAPMTDKQLQAIAKELVESVKSY